MSGVTEKIKSALGFKQPLATVEKVNFKDLLGVWYEISSTSLILGEQLMNSSITIIEYTKEEGGESSESEGDPSKFRIIYSGNKVQGDKISQKGELEA